MFALFATLAFLVAVILSETGGDLGLNYGGWVAAGLLLLAIHHLLGWPPPWNRQGQG